MAGGEGAGAGLSPLPRMTRPPPVATHATLLVGGTIALLLPQSSPPTWTLLPVVVLLHLVLAADLRRVVPATAAITIALVLLFGAGPTAHRFVGGAVLVTVYALGAFILGAVQRRATAGRPVEVFAHLVTVTALPPVAHRWLEQVIGLSPVGAPVGDVAALVRADLVGVLALLPLLAAFARGRHLGVPRRDWNAAAALAVIGVVAVVGAVGDPVLVTVAGAVPVAAALVLRRAPTMVVGSATLLTVAALGAGAGPAGLAALQLATLTGVAAAIVLAVLRSPETVVDPVATPEPVVLQGTGDPLDGLAVTRRQLVQYLRQVRTGIAAMLTVLMLAGLAGWWPLDPGLPVWLVAAGSILPVLGVNALSLHLDRSRGFTDRRELLEVVAECVALLLMTVPVAAFAPFVTLYTSMLWAVTMAVLRLPPRRAATVVGAYATIVIGAALTDALPIPIAPELPPAVLVITGLAPLLPGVVVAWSLHAQRTAQQRAQSSALALDALQGRIAAAERLARQARATAEATADSRARAIDQLEAANEELERSRASLERFASVMAHDLRSPLSTVRMAAETMGVGLPPERAAELIMRGVDRALRLLDRVYEHSRVSMTRLELRSVDLDVLVEGALFDVQERIVEANAIVVRGDGMPRAICDATLTGQVVANLLGNAIRYAGAGGRRPTIELTAVRTGTGVVVTVADDGPGLPESDEDVFEVGVRLTSERGGLGLGLATCREVVDRHEGRIWSHESRLGGAAFSFSLPDAHRGVTTVLVVEDDEDLRAAYRLALSGKQEVAPVLVLEAPTIAMARVLLRAHGGAIDVALVDLGLPDGDGRELLSELARHDVLVHVLTGMRIDAALRAELEGTGAHLTAKPDVLGGGGRPLRDRLLAPGVV